MAAAGRRNGLFHAAGVSPEQRVHRAALLIAALLLSAPLLAGDISFDPAITQQDFHTFSALLGQAVFPTPVEPASARGLLSFSVGVAVTAMPVDERAAYWVNSVASDFSTGGYVLAPRLIVSKGIGVANLSASYTRVPSSSIDVIGGAVDVPIINGGLVSPTLSARGSYAMLRGVDELDLKTYGAEAFLSKGFGPVTPYIAAGLARTSTVGRVPGFGTVPPRELSEEFDQKRYTVGLRFSLLVARIAVEATRQEDTSYAAKVNFGL